MEKQVSKILVQACVLNGGLIPCSAWDQVQFGDGQILLLFLCYSFLVLKDLSMGEIPTISNSQAETVISNALEMSLKKVIFQCSWF